MLKALYSKKELLVEPDKKFFKILKSILGYRPHRKILYYQKAFIHKSASKANSQGEVLNNERLEFLGDAILDSVIADYLFHKFPGKSEGFLTRLRSKIVNRDHLNHLALKLGINYLVISNTANCQHKYLYGDAFEALIGAVFIDKGYKRTRRIIIKRIIRHHINLNTLQHQETDFKSRIIEWGQKNKTQVQFECNEEQDDKSNDTVFMSHVIVADVIKGRGIGNSKKEAEQNAAKQALKVVTTNNNHHDQKTEVNGQ